jgi:hypothetical protein
LKVFDVFSAEGTGNCAGAGAADDAALQKRGVRMNAPLITLRN